MKKLAVGVFRTFHLGKFPAIYLITKKRVRGNEFYAFYQIPRLLYPFFFFFIFQFIDGKKIRKKR